ncbi:MAG: MotA/TolQ/ExbB proton channel family protein [Burkholderiaceae bacterium]|jgi:biopolymer transport protein ExbB|nr:MotA/TolQ/ExbB proton channel family protein [Burkholderiaceae bacterium]MDH5208383.1 MotA/TolQ/ExbB proton channel family protein [Burkholderiaceae bacterium]
MVRFIRRHAAVLAVILAVTGLAAPASSFAQADAQKAPPAADTPAAAPAAAPAPAPAAAPVAPVVTKETIDNPYGLEALWRQGDFVSKGTLIILVIMSMGSWYIIFVKLWEQAKLIREGREMRNSFWKAPSLRDGAKRLKDGSAYRYIAETGIDANEHHEGALTENIDLNTWVTMSVQRAVDTVQSRTQDGLSFLATVGSTAPFVGLFGTVWGIYHALTAIGIAGQASIDKVAGPVGEALIMTAIGLAVAVPAVMGYNWLVRRNKTAMETVRSFGADVHAVLLGRKSDVKVAGAR